VFQKLQAADKPERNRSDNPQRSIEPVNSFPVVTRYIFTTAPALAICPSARTKVCPVADRGRRHSVAAKSQSCGNNAPLLPTLGSWVESEKLPSFGQNCLEISKLSPASTVAVKSPTACHYRVEAFRTHNQRHLTPVHPSCLLLPKAVVVVSAGDNLCKFCLAVGIDDAGGFRSNRLKYLFCRITSMFSQSHTASGLTIV